jgi:phosphatidylglycerophosphatase A
MVIEQKNALSLKNPEILFLTFFGVGFAPKAPGTFGTIAALPFLYAAGQMGAPFIIFIPLIIVFTFISCFIADYAQRKYKTHDPGWIVIDEVLGMSVTWLFLQEQNLTHLALAFILFRAFDIFKIWPATYFDQEVHHGSGTILDDIISGVYAGVVYLGINATGILP